MGLCKGLRTQGRQTLRASRKKKARSSFAPQSWANFYRTPNAIAYTQGSVGQGIGGSAPVYGPPAANAQTQVAFVDSNPLGATIVESSGTGTRWGNVPRLEP